MRYRFDMDSWGAFFKVPASVPERFLKECDEAQLKVLLAVLSGSRTADTEQITERTGLAPEQVDGAVIYWCGKGVLSCKTAEGALPEIKEPVSQVPAVRPAGTPEPDKRVVVRYTQKEIRDKAEQDEKFKYLINEIQTVMQISVNATELGKLLELYELYRFDSSSILMAAQFCVSAGKRSINEVYKLMTKWSEQGIHSFNEVEQALIHAGELGSYASKVKRVFGIDNKLSVKQREFVEKWCGKGVSEELLALAYDRCMDSKGKLSFSYIDGILNNWEAAGLTSRYQIEAADESYRKRKSREDKSEKPSYDLEEFESYALKFGLGQEGQDQGL